MAKKRGYVFLIILAAVFWSVDALVRRHLSAIPSSIIVMIEHAISAAIALPWLARFLPEYKKMNFKDWLVALFIAVIGGGLAYTMYTEALSRVENISYSVVALLQQTQPIFAVFLAVILLKEKINKLYSLLAFIALAAAYFLAFPEYLPAFLGDGKDLEAALLAFGAAAFWGASTTLGKVLLKKISFAALALLRFMIVIPTAFVISLITRQSYPLSAITSTQWSYLGILAIFSGIISFVIYYKGLQHTEAKVATFAELTWPLGAAGIGYLFLGERLTLMQLVAALILLGDIMVLSFTAKEE